MPPPPAPGKWSPAEIVSHLADCELAFGFRLRQTLAEDEPRHPAIRSGKMGCAYPRIPAAQALATFAALRNWNLLLIESALPGAAGKTVTHPERGAMTFQTIVETMAGHDLNHIAQLKRFA